VVGRGIAEIGELGKIVCDGIPKNSICNYPVLADLGGVVFLLHGKRSIMIIAAIAAIVRQRDTRAMPRKLALNMT
jgi:hypothetical protein